MGPELGAQLEIPPHIAQYLFNIVSQRGHRTHFALFSCGIAQVSLRYPFCVGGGGGYRTSTLHALQDGSSEKGEGVSHRIGHVETPKTP